MTVCSSPQSRDHNPLYVDPEAAKAGPYGEIVAPASVRSGHFPTRSTSSNRRPTMAISAPVAQEKLIETSRIPYTIIRSTQFLEFLGGIDLQV